MNTGAVSFLDRLEKELPSEHRQHALSLRENYSNRLWHQLTETLLLFYNTPSLSVFYVDLYQQFVQSVGMELDQIKLTKMARNTAASLQEADPQASCELMASLIPKLAASKEATALATLYTGLFLVRAQKVDEAEECLSVFKTIQQASLDEIQTTLHLLRAEIAEKRNSHNEYYANMLQYLSLVGVSSLEREEYEAVLHKLCVSSLVGDDVFCFGDLVSLASEECPGSDSLFFYLKSFHQNRFDVFPRFLETVNTRADLAPFAEKIKKKITTVALVRKVTEMVRLGGCEISLKTLSEFLGLSLGTTEMLLVDSFILGILAGKINQKTNTARIARIKPTTMDDTQLLQLKESLDRWVEKHEPALSEEI
ncbi:MAG: 26S proteasome regulatory subunit N9, RPN9/PSMD13 [Amphiamblys sp. WSBS2006]|nr:MAG: 26S proteasome regulatory subunit N9, RPN9/PSMD13 [Amphiamblys sp. WSBS2006]